MLSDVPCFAQAEALAEFTDVQMALNLHVNEEVRQRSASDRPNCLCVRGITSLPSSCNLEPATPSITETSLPCCDFHVCFLTVRSEAQCAATPDSNVHVLG